MSGTDISEYAGRGINYRALDDLFSLRDERAPEVRVGLQGQRGRGGVHGAWLVGLVPVQPA